MLRTTKGSPLSNTSSYGNQPSDSTRSQYSNSGHQCTPGSPTDFRCVTQDHRLALMRRQTEELKMLGQKHDFELNELEQKHIKQKFELDSSHVPSKKQAMQAINPRYNVPANQNRAAILHSRLSQYIEGQQRVHPSARFKSAVSGVGFYRPPEHFQDTATNKQRPILFRENYARTQIPSTTQYSRHSPSASPRTYISKPNQLLPSKPISDPPIEPNQCASHPALTPQPQACVINLLDSSDSESDSESDTKSNTTRIQSSITHPKEPQPHIPEPIPRYQSPTSESDQDDDDAPMNLTSTARQRRKIHLGSNNDNPPPARTTQSNNLKSRLQSISATNKRLEALARQIRPYARKPSPEKDGDGDLRRQLLGAITSATSAATTTTTEGNLGARNCDGGVDVDSMWFTNEEEISMAMEYEPTPGRKRKLMRIG